MNKTQVLSASRAGLKSAVAVDAGAIKAQVVSDIGVVTSTAVGIVFVIHPFV
jgi:hypothetical protein